MTTILLALLCAQAAPPANQAEDVVTLKRKSFTWSFARIPERRMKADDGQEYDLPAQLFAAYTPLDPKSTPPPTSGSPFVLGPDVLIVDFFLPGKRYLEEDPASLPGVTQELLSDVSKAMLERFFEFDLDFPGGSWDDLGRMIKERLAAAYAPQLPEFLKAHFPAKIEIEITTTPEVQVRYPACQAKSITLAQLHGFGLAPVVDVRREAAPRVVRDKDGQVKFEMDSKPLLHQWNLSDGHRVDVEALEIAFFNLGERPGLPRPEDVVALFEMAWKAHGKPVFARVKYHPETKSIMLRAKPEEIAQAQRAYASLTGRPAQPEVSENPFDNITETLKKIAELLEARGEKDKDK